MWSDWAPPRTAESAWSAVRSMLFIGWAFVSVTAAVWQWKRRRIDSARVAPKRSFMSFAHTRRAARNFATSSKKSACATK